MRTPPINQKIITSTIKNCTVKIITLMSLLGLTTLTYSNKIVITGLVGGNRATFAQQGQIIFPEETFRTDYFKSSKQQTQGKRMSAQKVPFSTFCA